jgi:virginiamycin A acetyltransferase
MFYRLRRTFAKRLKSIFERNTLDTKGALLSLEGKNVINGRTRIRGTVTIGYCSTLGGCNQIMGGNIRIGRYCQIAPYVAIYAMNHPLAYLTTYVNSRLSVARLRQNQVPDSVTIGSDVWLGHGAIILPGVTIGDGAVIGAGAVVTKNVPTYCVAAGNPARVIRQRFSEQVVAELCKLKWWEFEEGDINHLNELFEIDLCAEEQRALKLIRSAFSSRRGE